VALSIFVWVMIGMALWHFSVLVPDRFWGGIIGAFGAAVAGALLSGYLLPEPRYPRIEPARDRCGRLDDARLPVRASRELLVRRPPGPIAGHRQGLGGGAARNGQRAARRMVVCTHGRGPLRRPRLFDDNARPDS
jgi:hypothetical protein